MRAHIKGEGSQGEKTGPNVDVLMLSCWRRGSAAGDGDGGLEEEAGPGADRCAETRSPAALGSA